MGENACLNRRVEGLPCASQAEEKIEIDAMPSRYDAASKIVRSSCGQRFADQTKKCFVGVSVVQSYFDTIQINTNWRDGRRAVTLLQAAAVTVIFGKSKNPRLPCLLRIHQMPFGRMGLLHQVLHEYSINRFDVAFDFFFEENDAQSIVTLGEFLAKHITQRWHGKRKMSRIENTIYLAPAWRGRNASVYSDRVQEYYSSSW
ncbi:MAG: hypothetical protein WA821_21940 [Anaerolineales bacterium]